MHDRAHSQDAPPAPDATRSSVPWLRTALTGCLMGLANLVPGVSGGTMVLVMGLYDDFVSSVADATRLRFTRRSVAFLAVLGGVTLATIASLSGPMGTLVSLHRTAMYALFIGMTLGGAPLLLALARPLRGPVIASITAGLLVMVVVAASRPQRPATKDIRAQGVRIEPHYALDTAAGLLGMSAMVLPGVSGAYMLLILGRYETILAAISAAKTCATSLGKTGDMGPALGVIIPVAVGSIISLVAFTNLLKWMLHHYEKVTAGFLLGVLVGSVVGIWPFDAFSTPRDYLIAPIMSLLGFGVTFYLSHLRR
jgi:putative membrane protein